MLQIDNKFNIGDTVYIVSRDKLQKGIIRNIDIFIESIGDYSIRYLVEFPTFTINLPEFKLSNTPEEAINRLLKDD